MDRVFNASLNLEEFTGIYSVVAACARKYTPALAFLT